MPNLTCSHEWAQQVNCGRCQKCALPKIKAVPSSSNNCPQATAYARHGPLNSHHVAWCTMYSPLTSPLAHGPDHFYSICCMANIGCVVHNSFRDRRRAAMTAHSQKAVGTLQLHQRSGWQQSAGCWNATYRSAGACTTVEASQADHVSGFAGSRNLTCATRLLPLVCKHTPGSSSHPERVVCTTSKLCTAVTYFPY